MAKIDGPKPEAGQELYDVSEKVFPDIKAEPGEEAWIFMHTVPYEGSVGLVNLLTATRLVRKGFKTSLVLYGPGVLMASGTRGYPAVGQEAFPGHMAINNQIKTLLNEGATIYACRFAMGALYGFREDDLIEGVTAVQPARRARLGPDRLAQQGLPAQHLDGLAPSGEPADERARGEPAPLAAGRGAPLPGRHRPPGPLRGLHRPRALARRPPGRRAGRGRPGHQLPGGRPATRTSPRPASTSTRCRRRSTSTWCATPPTRSRSRELAPAGRRRAHPARHRPRPRRAASPPWSSGPRASGSSGRRTGGSRCPWPRAAPCPLTTELDPERMRPRFALEALQLDPETGEARDEPPLAPRRRVHRPRGLAPGRRRSCGQRLLTP